MLLEHRKQCSVSRKACIFGEQIAQCVPTWAKAIQFRDTSVLFETSNHATYIRYTSSVSRRLPTFDRREESRLRAHILLGKPGSLRAFRAKNDYIRRAAALGNEITVELGSNRTFATLLLHSSPLRDDHAEERSADLDGCMLPQVRRIG